MAHQGDGQDSNSQIDGETPSKSPESADKNLFGRKVYEGGLIIVRMGTDYLARFKDQLAKIKGVRDLRLGGGWVVAVAICAALVFMGALAQGLTAGLFRTVRVAGIESGAGQRDSSIAISLVDRGDRDHAKRTANERPKNPDKTASIRDFSEVRSDGGTTENAQGGDSRLSYLPPNDRKEIIFDTRIENEDQVVITVPVGQGRLLTFDEAVESVFIADTTIADIKVVSPELVYVYGKRLGHTNLLATSVDNDSAKSNSDSGLKLTGSALLQIVSDTGPLAEAKRRHAPDAPVRFDLFGRRVVASGRVHDVNEAVKVDSLARTFSPQDLPPINSTELEGSNQVNIRVRFAEVSRSDLKSFGIDWNVSLQAGSFSFGLAKNNGRTPGTQPNLDLGVEAGNFNIDLLIEALKANGALTVLAEPNLTAVTGETANFLAGGEVPIPVPNGTDGQAITVQYKSFGVSLSFTPTLIKRNRISLRVKPEVSSIAAQTSFGVQGFNLPSFTVRRADTVVEIASGQTFALAGLFQRETSRSVDKIPVLGEMPILGPLFRSERYQRNESELVILITPYLVNPVSDREVATPLDVKREPQLAPQAAIQRDDWKAPAPAPAERDQPYGFIMK